MGSRVMLVDYIAFTRMIQRELLHKNHYEVIAEAVTGEEAISLYKDLRPDVVIMEVTMPDMDGIDVLRCIRRLDPDARVIICSALAQEQIVIQTIVNGARDFVVKPYKPQRLIDSLQKTLG